MFGLVLIENLEACCVCTNITCALHMIFDASSDKEAFRDLLSEFPSPNIKTNKLIHAMTWQQDNHIHKITKGAAIRVEK